MDAEPSSRYRPPPGSIPTLEVPDPSPWRRLHLVGIGGAGMNGLARLLIARGVEVSGSDLKGSRGLDALRALGATGYVGHRAGQVERAGRPDAVVISSAIPPGNAELAAAQRSGIIVLRRAQVLAALMRGTRSVAVAGTHGKTTTTSMISVLLSRAGLDPTFAIGGELNESGSGAGTGSGDVFVAEADESDGSFLLAEPHVGVITNVEVDHIDFYRGGAEEVEAAFAAFAGRCRTVVACRDDPGAVRSLKGIPAPVVWYGTDPASDVRVTVLAEGPRAKARLDVGDGSVMVDLGVPGVHNALNAAAAVAVARLLGVDLDRAGEALTGFSGVRRRFEHRGIAAGATFVDDYAHHPTEVAATLRSARSDGRRVVAVFQPHRYSRTEVMWRAFGPSLAAADLVVVTDVYPAGEQPIPGVSGRLVVQAVAEAAPGKRIVYLPRRTEIAPFLASEVRPGDLVLTLGAGDITMVAGETLSRLGAGAGEAP